LQKCLLLKVKYWSRCAFYQRVASKRSMVLCSLEEIIGQIVSDKGGSGLIETQCVSSVSERKGESNGRAKRQSTCSLKIRNQLRQ